MIKKIVPTTRDLNFINILKNNTNMKSTSEIKFQIAILFCSLSVSMIIGFVPNWSNYKFSPADQILLTIGFFLSFQSLHIFWNIWKILSHKIQMYELWKIQELGDREINNIRSHFSKIIQSSYGADDLFVTNFLNELHKLSNNISDVAEKKEFRAKANHFLGADNVLNAFRGDSARIWRYTWRTDPEEKLFDDLHWKFYFEKASLMAKNGEITEIKAIIVLPDKKCVEKPRVKKLLEFYASNERQGCRVITAKDYQTMCEDNQVQSNYIDFGIYGNRLLFLTEQYEPEIIGIFSKDEELINNYTKLFDAMWDSVSICQSIQAQLNEKLTLKDLFDFDQKEG